jgi:hypothetical protein
MSESVLPGNTHAPKQVQMSRQRPWRAEHPDAVICDRRSRYGNPFRVIGTPGHGGSVIGPEWFEAKDEWGRPRRRDEYAVYHSCSDYGLAVEHAVGLFDTLCQVRLRDSPRRFEAWIAPLRGRDLACWCGPDQSCHCDVLLRIANREDG